MSEPLVFTVRWSSSSSRAARLYTLHVQGCPRAGDDARPLDAFPTKSLPLITRVRAGLNAKACRVCKPLDHLPRHETYVYRDGRRWAWNCQQCSATGGGFPRRMDADEDAERHESSPEQP